MKCKICGSTVNKIFNSKVLQKYNIDYFRCDSCGFIQTQNPFWLKESYKNSITMQDTGLIERNLYYSSLIPLVINIFFDKNGKFLDFAGGYGIFTRLMQNKGLNFYWFDTYTENIFAKGFEYKTQKIKFDAITCFECFEHFKYPLEEFEKLLKLSKTIIFSTTLIPEKNFDKNWYYYGFEHGQHISFYSKKTLRYIASKNHLNLYSISNLHILTDKKLNKLSLYLLLFLLKIKYRLVK